MDTPDYREYIRDHILEYLPDTYKDAEVALTQVTKGNDEILTALQIACPGEWATPSIYLEEFAESLMNGRDICDVMREIANRRVSHVTDPKLHERLEILTRYDTAHSLLKTHLCDPDLNPDYLQNKPWTPVGGLAMYYKLDVVIEDAYIMAVAVTDHMLDAWGGITPEQLHKDAVEANRSTDPPIMFDAFNPRTALAFHADDLTLCENLLEQDVLTHPSSTGSYMLTHRSMHDGAAVIGWDGVLEKAADLLRTDFYVLPISIDQVMICPPDCSKAFLQEALFNGNRTTISGEKLLSDKVHYYNRLAKKLKCLT